ncbi:MAG: 2-(3-amino-3-carboxypropyl)histidine synthase [Candidatus Woesearchaeota archaeon]|nr:2-(3-amino-3-carboxypropyl)histidine synthase [Candidatus Woesearchaeota archaeon]
MEYEFEIEKIIKQINKQNAKIVCLQLSDGLKPKAKTLQEEIEKNTRAQVILWAGTCFGACDIPVELKNMNADLLVQFGHSEWK